MNRDSCPQEVCLTCSDAAEPAVVLAVRPGALADVRGEAGVAEEVSVALVDVRVGDTVLVHAGEAIAVVEISP